MHGPRYRICKKAQGEGMGLGSRVRVWDVHAWSLKSPSQETLSLRPPSCANGGG